MCAPFAPFNDLQINLVVFLVILLHLISKWSIEFYLCVFFVFYSLFVCSAVAIRQFLMWRRCGFHFNFVSSGDILNFLLVPIHIEAFNQRLTTVSFFFLCFLFHHLWCVAAIFFGGFSRINWKFQKEIISISKALLAIENDIALDLFFSRLIWVCSSPRAYWLMICKNPNIKYALWRMGRTKISFKKIIVMFSIFDYYPEDFFLLLFASERWWVKSWAWSFEMIELENVIISKTIPLEEHSLTLCSVWDSIPQDVYMFWLWK